MKIDLMIRLLERAKRKGVEEVKIVEYSEGPDRGVPCEIVSFVVEAKDEWLLPPSPVKVLVLESDMK